ncbi:YGGT domain-containing protein [Cephalotus follicularis]|uniref:YGGT domain-containing protein n=1 Tax=Cephalotus follicularis TaxID=3775 RepID=A0A1Q3BT29_CEPFO|nr:YGGT domain-containing protein [Cephalotus follicularis]
MATNEKRRVPGFVLLSSSIMQNPLVKRNVNGMMGVSDHVRSSITSTADKCLRFIHMLASQNPILNRLLSFSSPFTFTQIQCGNNKNVNALWNHNFAAILPGDSVAVIVATNGISNFLNLYNTLLIVRLVLTWFPNTPPAIVSPLSTLCDPYLNIFRGIIPPLGGTLDLSPILAFLVLNAFTSTAAALPAELPPTGASHRSPSSYSKFPDLTSSQKKWMRRLCRDQSKGSNVVD